MQRPCRPAQAERRRAADAEARPIYLLNIVSIESRQVDTKGWLARVRHDLVKRLVWPARDRRDAGGAPAPGELVAALVDDEGAPTTAAALWAELAAEGPPESEALTRFGAALEAAVAAGTAGDVDGVLALEPAFDRLARSLARSLEGKSA